MRKQSIPGPLFEEERPGIEARPPSDPASSWMTKNKRFWAYTNDYLLVDLNELALHANQLDPTKRSIVGIASRVYGF